MKKYEIVCVFNPTTAVDKIDDILSKMEKKIKDGGGTLEKTDKIGTRQLNYAFKKFNKTREGYYTITYFSSEGDLITKLNSMLRITEEIMRYSIILSRSEQLEKVEVELPGAEIEEKPASVQL